MSTINLLRLDSDTILDTGESVVFAPPSLLRGDNFGKAQTTLYEDSRGLMAVYNFDASGALNFSQPVALFDEFLLQSVVEASRDLTQFILSSDAPKLYSLGQNHRFFSVFAILLDTDLNQTLGARPDARQTPAEKNLLQFKGWSGEGLSSWQSFYERFASLESCAKNRTLVGFQYMNRRLYGAFVSANITHLAMRPHEYDLSAAFYAVFIENVS